jgi:hypothetical protein
VQDHRHTIPTVYRSNDLNTYPVRGNRPGTPHDAFDAVDFPCARARLLSRRYGAAPGGKQAGVARLLRAIGVRPVDEQMGRDAGALLAKARTDDPIDATVVLVARSGNRVLTSDPDDIGRLASRSGKRLAIVPC